MAESPYAEPFDMEDPKPDDRLRPALEEIIGRLEREADDRVQKRLTVEKRWLDDLRQLHSQYDKDTVSSLKAAKKSQLFINETRPKTTTCESKLSDMLFPTDDRNWGIGPTPVPDMMRQADDAKQQAEALADKAEAAAADNDPASAELAAQGLQFAEETARLKAVMDDARKRSEAMADEIEDQLIESNYASQCRDVIHDACGLGTGVMKGPVGSSERSRRAWQMRQKEEGAADATNADVYDLSYVEETRPAFYKVDLWGWFPETDARTLEESSSFFERHLMMDKGLRDLAKQPGFDKDAIRRLLTEGKPRKALPSYVSDLRAITGESPAITDFRWQVWEYRGPLETSEMETLCNCLGRQDLLGTQEGIDPLEEINVVLWFVDGEVLKFGIHHLDSGEAIYSVYNLVKDDSSIWGYGIPYVMRDAQKALNGAWRMMMDNAGLSSGPQIEIDTDVIEPADGTWLFTARKIWLRKKGAPAGKKGITTYNIESHQAELESIIVLAKQFMDDVTNISVLASGEQGAHTTQTSGGMALLMNAVNVIFRGMTKNFDDDMTVPNIRRLYDWNMQFSKKEHIKGDFDVNARGTSVLLVREVQSQNLMILANLTQHPVLGLMLKAVPILRKLAQSMMIEADEIVLTDDELKRQAEQTKEQGEPLDPKVEAENIKRETTLLIAQYDRETQMMKLAEARNMNIDDLEAMLEGKRQDRASKERIFAGEVAVEARKDATGDTTGSGGYIS